MDLECHHKNGKVWFISDAVLWQAMTKEDLETVIDEVIKQLSEQNVTP